MTIQACSHHFTSILRVFIPSQCRLTQHSKSLYLLDEHQVEERSCDLGPSQPPIMCGRYVLSMRPGQVRQRLANQDMPAEDAPGDEDIRQTYNFAPGYHGLIYRANTSDRGAGGEVDHDIPSNGDGHGDDSSASRTASDTPSSQHTVDGRATKETKYKLQAARWGLIPFWTKRAPDYASQMRTINCRDDSLIENRGMWNTMKQRKRCIVVAVS